MKRIIIGLLAIGLLIIGTIPAITLAAGECPAGFADKVDTSDGSIVLEAGLIVCIKAGDDNTGTFTTDGESTLAEYIEASGLLNNGGQVPNVSHYVVYDAEPTPTPTPVVTPTPDVTPTPPPTPTPTPVVTPSPPPGGLFSVPAFSIECGGFLTVSNFEFANVDAAVVDPVGLVITEDGVYPLAPGDYRIYGVVDDEVVTDEVPFTIVACPEPTPTPTPTAPPATPTPTPVTPTLPPTDTE